MSTIALKNRVWREFLLPINFFSKKRKLVARIMLGVFLLEIILFLFFIKYVIVSDTGSYSLAAIALAATNDINNIKPGLATEQFVTNLKNAGLRPIVVQKIKRVPFSVEGELISLNGDNMQVFEYSDNETALKEATIFVEKYTDSVARNQWKSRVHLYVRGNIIIFYMGTEKNILTALNKDINHLLLNNKKPPESGFL